MNQQMDRAQRGARAATAPLLAALAALALATSLSSCGHRVAPSGDMDAQDAASAGRIAGGGAGSRTDDPLRRPLNGTLHYTIVVSGGLAGTGPHAGGKRTASVRRRAEVTTGMRAVVSNGPIAANNPNHPAGAEPAGHPKTKLDELARQGQACNGNAACMMKISMKLATDPGVQREAEAAGNAMVAMIGRTAIFGPQGTCRASIVVDDNDDSATFHQEWGEGYHPERLDVRRTTATADATMDCSNADSAMEPAMAQLADPDATRLFLDRQTGEYDITFAPALADAATTADGEPAVPARAGTPRIALTGLTGAAVDKPLHGSRSVELEPENGVPLRAEIEWTFTPDAP